MVHDLTANSDFQQSRGFNSLLGRIVSDFGGVRDEFESLTPPYDEIVLTGTTSDRDLKRYVLDYESDQKNMCDCCGSPIRIRPWDFDENKTLCHECEKWLEETHNSREDNRLLEEVIDDSLAVRVVKPWDIRDFDRENAVDNVLLWD